MPQDVVGIKISIVAYEDRTLVVLIGVVYGTVKELGCELYALAGGLSVWGAEGSIGQRPIVPAAGTSDKNV